MPIVTADEVAQAHHALTASTRNTIVERNDTWQFTAARAVDAMGMGHAQLASVRATTSCVARNVLIAVGALTLALATVNTRPWAAAAVAALAVMAVVALRAHDAHRNGAFMRTDRALAYWSHFSIASATITAASHSKPQDGSLAPVMPELERDLLSLLRELESLASTASTTVRARSAALWSRIDDVDNMVFAMVSAVMAEALALNAS